MTNETLQTIRSRRSCRAYEPRQITDAELDAVLEAGTYAASAMGRQSAKIVVVQDAATRAQLTRMNAAVMGTSTCHQVIRSALTLSRSKRKIFDTPSSCIVTP